MDGPVWTCLLFSHHQTEVMDFWEEYEGEVPFSLQNLGKRRMST